MVLVTIICCICINNSNVKNEIDTVLSKDPDEDITSVGIHCRIDTSILGGAA
jgi:hypothetical protein